METINIFITNPENLDVATHCATRLEGTLNTVLIADSTHTAFTTQSESSATFEVSGCFNGSTPITLADSGLASTFANAGNPIGQEKYVVSAPNNSTININDGGLSIVAEAFNMKSGLNVNVWIIEPNERVRLLSKIKLK